MKILQDAISLALDKLEAKVEFKVERPNDDAHGDYSTNSALVVGASMGRGTRDIAEQLVGILKEDNSLDEVVESVEAVGPGFINFKLTDKYLVDEFLKVSNLGSEYGVNDLHKDRLAIVEYSSPNIAKPFTVGHLRSTVIGDSVANLLEANGWKVLRDNHLGDWGTQFGKQIVAIKKWGNVDEIEKSDNPVKELVKLYVKFHEEAESDESLIDQGREWFKKLEDGNEEARELWKKCIDWSWKEFSRIYEMLNVKHSEEFDGGRGLGESYFEDKMPNVIKILEAHDWYKEGEGGAKLVFFADDKFPPAMILKKDGATLYHTRDLATDKHRLDEYNPDLIINEVGAEQTLYFQQLFEIERMLGWFQPDQRHHLSHGLIRFKEGKMSTRKGNVVWLEEVLNEAVERAKNIDDKREIDDELARKIAIGAIKWNDLKGDPKRSIVFDWDEVLNMKGDSGPYVQYTYARARSVLRKSSSEQDAPRVDDLTAHERAVITWIMRYPEIVISAGEKFAPNMVANYLFELSQRFNSFYNREKIIGSDREAVRIAMCRVVSTVIKNGLEILGIEAPEVM